MSERFHVILLNLLDPTCELARQAACDSAGWNHAGEFCMRNFIEIENGRETEHRREWRDVGPWYVPFVVVRAGDSFNLVQCEDCCDTSGTLTVDSIRAAGHEVYLPDYENHNA